MIPDNVKKYLSKQNNSTWKIETGSEKLFNNIIVIPALNEFENINNLLESILKNEKKILHKTLFVFVINNTSNEKPEIKDNNQKTLNFLRNNFLKHSVLQIGIIDASTGKKELPVKNGGVGLARKIGMDLSLKYFDYSTKNKKLLINLDADCTVSKNYLSTIVKEFNKNNHSAGYVNFEHPLPQNIEEQKAIVNYEIFLRYYVLGLKYANSPYAFHTVGSTIICDYESYIKVGGMNKRKAGEDFYFMEKLAKINDINFLKSATVYPSARTSERVPFGTGQRISRFLSGEKDEYLIYSPEIFEVLKSWLNIFQNKNLQASEHLERAKTIDEELYNFFIKESFLDDWNKILINSKTELQIKRQKKLWMDGFRTLKLIHYLRDKKYPQEKMFNALDILFNKMKIENTIKRKEEIPPLETQLQYLKLLRKLN